MTAEHADHQVVARIGFAQRWLERARGQVAAGNLTRGILTLALADAEVRHALEQAGARPSRPRILRSTLGGAAGAIAALIALFAVWPAGEPNSDAAAVDHAPPIVSLSPRVGTLLDLLSPAPQASPIVAVPRTHSPAAVREVSAPLPSLYPPAIQSMPVSKQAPVQAPAQASPAQPTPVVPPAPTIVAVQPALPQLSAGDLLDLVLAAERALRDSTTPPP